MTLVVSTLMSFSRRLNRYLTTNAKALVVPRFSETGTSYGCHQCNRRRRMNKVRAAFLLGLFCVTPGQIAWTQSPQIEISSQSGFSELRVGVTGIFCYMEPCPWNGVMMKDGTVLSSAIIWSGRTPPRLAASDDDAIRIITAYSDGCLIIDGRMTGDELEVRRIIGEC